MSRVICNWLLPGTICLDDISQFEAGDVFYHCDTVNPGYIDDVVQKKGLPQYIVNDNAYEIDIPGYTIYAAPFRGLGIETIRWKDKVLLDPGHTLQTDFAVNFCINKKQINRYLAMKMVEILQIENFTYTWSGIGKNFDLTELFDELKNRDPGYDIINRHIRSEVGNPIKIDPIFLMVNPAQHFNNSFVKDRGNECETWNAGLNNIFNRSAVSLITESVNFQYSSVFTEKTLYSIYGLTFPLFVGGYNMIDSMSGLGFDVFDDIFDHSYQNKPTLFERCYQAFNFNQHLLRDLKTLQKLRQKCLPRLLANRRSLYDRFMMSKIKQKIMDWPYPLQQIMQPHWRFLDQT